VLNAMGASTVSMSLAAEVRAAHDEGLAVAAIAVVVNSGDTTHEEVLSGSVKAGPALTSAIETMLAAAPLYWNP
jgi:purine nucleoside phosphorylase